MKAFTKAHPFQCMFFIYFLCFIFRIIEYMLLRTDQSIFGEAFLHKLVGIGILAWAVQHLSLKWKDIGFRNQHALKYALYGLLLGFGVFVLAYGTEFFMQASNGNNPVFRMYVTSYAIDGNQGMQTGLIFFIICIVGNMINVVMEEGIFRGLFIRLSEAKVSFMKAALFSSLLFGAWHVMAPLRNFLDGEMSGPGAVMYGLVLILTTGITGFKFCLLAKLSGSLWMPMADHFFNNTIINLLHVVTISGADEMQALRITIAQTVSFILVLILYLRQSMGQKSSLK